MVQQLANAPMVATKTLGEQTILIKCGDSDDSLYYQAAIMASPNGTSFRVYFHPQSLVLERLRLHGSLTVSAQRADGRVYRATLSDACIEEGVRLSLYEICDEVITAPRLMPLT